MKVAITIACDNAAFEDDPGAEVARILHNLAERIANYGPIAPGDFWAIKDANGNKVGVAKVE